MRPVQLCLLLLQLELHLLNILRHALHFEVVPLHFAHGVPFGASFLLQVFGQLDELLVLFHLQKVTVSSHVSRFTVQLLFPSLMRLKISSELSDQLSVLLVIDFRLQGLILNHELTRFLPLLIFVLSDFFLKLMSLSIKLHFDNI